MALVPNEIDTNEKGANEIDTNEILDDEILDTKWIDDFKKNEEIYNEFYKEPVKSINIYLLYVNKDNELEHIHSDKCFINENGLLKREIIISFIKRYQDLYSIHYKLLSLLKYNIDLEPIDIKEFINEDVLVSNQRFLYSEKYLEDIHFKESINMFQDLNALFFLFYEEKLKLNNTKRVKLSSQQQHKTKRNNHIVKNLKINKQLG
jgi:hypothetical protein